MIEWRCYPTTSKSNLWKSWFDGQNKRVQAKHDVVFRFLSQTRYGLWGKPHVKHLKGKPYKGLFEIIISADIEWRLICCRGKGAGEIVVLIICNHKRQVYDPTNALDTAKYRRKEVEDGTVGVIVVDIPRSVGTVPRQGVSGIIPGSAGLLSNRLPNPSAPPKGRNEPKRIR